jgi:hypothetical protein
VQVTVLKAHEPGAEAEVDFGQLYAQVAGVLLKLWMFVMRLSCSDRVLLVARDERAAGRYGEVLVLDQYLKVLARKPGALPGVTALAQARAPGASQDAISHTSYTPP